MNKLNIKDQVTASVGKESGNNESLHLQGFYELECYDKDGNLKWKDTIKNLVTTVGKNDALDKYLSGSAYTATWYLGLIGATSYTTGAAVGDTMASHSGWVEDQNYSQTSRPTASFNSASAGAKTTSAALVYSINATTTIKGSFLANNATKGGTTGILFSAGLLTGGDKALASGDTLNVTYTLNA